MAEAFKKRTPGVKVVTAVGTAVYPRLNTPDTKFNPLGVYTCKVRLAAEAAAPLIEKIDAVGAAFFESEKAELMKGDGKAKARAKALKMADPAYKAAVNDEGDETGEYEFNFKMNARIVREGKADIILKPDVFDAKGTCLKAVPDIWGGTRLSVAGELNPFNSPTVGVGVALRLSAVQIIELRSGGARDAAGFGFAAQEGFEASDEDTAPAVKPAADDPSSTGETDDEF